MFRQYTAPDPCEYDTQEDYQDALDAYDAEMMLREDMYIEMCRERERENTL